MSTNETPNDNPPEILIFLSDPEKDSINKIAKLFQWLRKSIEQELKTNPHISTSDEHYIQLVQHLEEFESWYENILENLSPQNLHITSEKILRLVALLEEYINTILIAGMFVNKNPYLHERIPVDLLENEPKTAYEEIYQAYIQASHGVLPPLP